MPGQLQEETNIQQADDGSVSLQQKEPLETRAADYSGKDGGQENGDVAQPDEELSTSARKSGHEFSNPRPPFGDYPGFYFEEGLVLDNARLKVTAAAIAKVSTLSRKFTGNDEVMSEEDVIEYYVNNPDAGNTDAAVIISTATKELLGYIMATVNKRTGQCRASVIVNPHLENREVIYRAGLDEAMIAIKSHIEDIVEGKPVTISAGSSTKQTENVAVLEEKGFAFTRTWLNMEISLADGDIEAGDLPPGLELRPYVKDDHARSLYEAQQEAFRDHSGHAEDTPFDKWLHWHHGPNMKEDLFIVAWDGDKIAGAVFASDDNKNLPGLAYIDIVFVRRPYRRQSLALSLLRHSFRVLQERGFATARLFVDGKSKTNAVSLYQRAGMSVKREYLSYRLLVQGNPEDVVD